MGDDPGQVYVLAGYSKHRRRDVLPLRTDTAAVLGGMLAGKMPAAPAFNVPGRRLAATMLRKDLLAARAKWLEAVPPAERAALEKSDFLADHDDAGRVADFHSLRHTAGTLLAASNVHPKVAQSLMRHGDVNLTMSRYSHVLVGQESDAVAALPDLALPAREAAALTGTDPVARQLARRRPEGANGGNVGHDGEVDSAGAKRVESPGNGDVRQRPASTVIHSGEVPERLIGPVSKTGVASRGYRGFESPPLRHRTFRRAFFAFFTGLLAHIHFPA